jgi:hypothetical protein
MVIVETGIFTKRIVDLISDEKYREFQTKLVEKPDLGTLIPGTHGLRKVRIAAKGHGKRGGARVIYYWAVLPEQILMLYVFAKGEQADLSTAEKKMLGQIVKEKYPL